jgi:flagellar hook protein FlgE
MFDSIFIGMSGLQGFSKGLKVISNNVANLNTPGFKSSGLSFSDAFYQQGDTGGGYALGNVQVQYGTGLTTLPSRLNFQQGEIRQTGNSLDLSISGEGLFVLKDATSDTEHYTRAGQFQFDKNGDLTAAAGGKYVMGYPKGGTSGALERISLSGLRTSPAKATTKVSFGGNLSSTATEFDLDSVKLVDSVGAEHVVRLNFKNKGSAAPGVWTVTVFDGTTSVASGDIKFVNGEPDTSQDTLTFSYTPSGGTAFDVKLDFSADVTSFASGTTSSLAFKSQDGYLSGAITDVSFDTDGYLSLTYSNGQTAKGARIALASFESNLGLQQAGGAEFTATGAQARQLGRPGESGLGAVQSGQLELSNVDLSSEFSDLIVMQRGYQASSRIVSTANDMLQELFDMKGNR